MEKTAKIAKIRTRKNLEPASLLTSVLAPQGQRGFQHPGKFFWKKNDEDLNDAQAAV